METESSYGSTGSLRKFGRNAILNVGGFVIGALCYMVIVPFTLRTLGKAQYGIWALTKVVTSFAGLSCLGLDQALVKYIAEFSAQSKTDEIRRIVSTAFVFFIVIAFDRLSG